jgi:hypothetical protein
VEICFSDHVSCLLAIASWKIIPDYKGGSQPGFGMTHDRTGDRTRASSHEDELEAFDRGILPSYPLFVSRLIKSGCRESRGEWCVTLSRPQ